MEKFQLQIIDGGILGRYYDGDLTIQNSYYTTTGSLSVHSNEKYVTADTLKGYATTLGDAYLTDEYNINEGYPILEWELNAKKILGKAYVNADEEKIVVEITHHKYNIARVVNENGTLLSKASDTIFKEAMTSGVHTYTIIDSEGNEKIVSIKLQLISSASDLCDFRNAVNNGNSFAGYNVIQTANIDLSNVCGEGIGSWEPIGTTGTYFAGTYDGGYHTISNLYINSNQYQKLGMFIQTTESTIIRNLILEDVNMTNTINAKNTNNYLGGITGYNFGTIERCGIQSGKLVSNVTSSEVSYAGPRIGGIVGRSEKGVISDCYNKANIEAKTCNDNYSAINLGGIIGQVYPNKIEITNCYNTGKLNAISGYIKSVGGIIGDNQGNTTSVVGNCYNTGELSSADYRGGIIGINDTSASIKNSYYTTTGSLNTIDGEKYVTGDTLKTYSETLGNAYMADEYEINDGYPILDWELNKLNIAGKVYVNTNEEKIVVEITHHKNNILIVTNEKGLPLSRISNTIFTETMTEGTHTYTIIDSEGNQIELNLGPIKFLDSANSLNEFRDAVNNGNDFAGITVIQTSNIDLSSVCGEGNSWTPIGANGTKFAGTYDGQYHTISNLYIDSNQYQYVGLFAQSAENSVIENIEIENMYIKSTYYAQNMQSRIGGIVGENNGIIKNCGIESGNIICIKSQSIDEASGIGFVGGIVGRNFKTIDGCYNKGTVYEKTTSQAHVGGIAGAMMENAKITNSYNTGNLTALGDLQVMLGGIAGYTSRTGVKIENCYNIIPLQGARPYSESGTSAIFGSINGGQVTAKNAFYLTGQRNDSGIGTEKTETELKGSASTLGDAYTNDDGRNNGYPILKWELERK